MQRSIQQSPVITRLPALVILAVISGILFVGLLTLTAQSKLGGALLLLARHALRLVPPGGWIVALLIVMLWLIVLRREWRS